MTYKVYNEGTEVYLTIRDYSNFILSLPTKLADCVVENTIICFPDWAGVPSDPAVLVERIFPDGWEWELPLSENIIRNLADDAQGHSYIRFRGDEGYRWGYTLKGGKVYAQDVEEKVSWTESNREVAFNG